MSDRVRIGGPKCWINFEIAGPAEIAEQEGFVLGSAVATELESFQSTAYGVTGDVPSTVSRRP